MLTREKVTNLMNQYASARRAVSAFDSSMKLLVKELSSVKCDSCHNPVKASVHYNPLGDTYHFTIKCPQCNRIMHVDSSRPKYWLIDLREKMNKTIEEVAAATGLHPRTIEKAEQYCGVIEVMEVVKLSRFYGVPIGSIHLEPIEQRAWKGGESLEAIDARNLSPSMV